MTEQRTHFLQVFSQNTVSLTFCQTDGKLFPFSDTVTVCNIRMMFRTMPSFIFLDTLDSRFPTWVFHILLCPQRSYRHGQYHQWQYWPWKSYGYYKAPPSWTDNESSTASVSSSPASLKSNSISVMFPQLSSTTTMKFCASSHSEV